MGIRFTRMLLSKVHAKTCIRYMARCMYSLDVQAQFAQPKKILIDANAVSSPISELPFSASIKSKLASKNIQSLYPIQAETFSMVHDGADMIVRARTGTGKTLCFALPLIEKILQNRTRNPQVLVLAPTRELAKQVASEFEKFGPQLNVSCLYGGVSYINQIQELRRGCDVVVGTPGRVMDLYDKGSLTLDGIQTCVLDEADHMLDIGFASEMTQVLQNIRECSEKKPQVLLFSATMPEWIKREAVKHLNKDYVYCDAIGEQKIRTSENIEQIAIPCTQDSIATSVADIMDYFAPGAKTIIFTESKVGADSLGYSLPNTKKVGILHGDVSQHKREQILSNFKSGRINCIVATDVAARGLDVPNVALVIQLEPPKTVESFIHRSGRTARAGKTGVSVLLYDPSQHSHGIRNIEREAGIVFKKIGVPSNDLRIEKQISELRSKLGRVSIHPLVSELADQLLNDPENDPKKIVASALSLSLNISDSVQSRSLITGAPGLKTLVATSTSHCDPTMLTHLLRQEFGQNSSSLKNFRPVRGYDQVTFDVDFQFADQFLADCSENPSIKQSMELSEAKEVPNYVPPANERHFTPGKQGYRRNHFVRNRPNIRSTYDGRDRRGNFPGTSEFGRNQFHQKRKHNPFI